MSEKVGTKPFIDRIAGLFAFVFVMAIGGIVGMVPKPVMIAITGLWFFLLALLIWSSVSWARGHLDPKD